MNNILQSRCDDLKRATERLSTISAHDASTILKASLGVPKMLFIMRLSPCTDHPLLRTYDDLLRESLSSITKNHFGFIQWIQASLPVKDGGLGIRSEVTLAHSAYLSSAAATFDQWRRNHGVSGVSRPPTFWSTGSSGVRATVFQITGILLVLLYMRHS